MKSFIDLQDYADPTGIEDASQGLINAAAQAKLQGLRLVGEGTYRLNTQVDLRYTQVDMPSTTFNSYYSDGPVIVLGGNASSTKNPRQSLGVINRMSDNGSDDIPDVRIIGAKCQHIAIHQAKHIQIYADGTDRKEYSSAYSTMTFVYVNTLAISGVDGGWVNENQFFLNRIHAIKIEGDYHHNHNKFYAGTMEGHGEIDLQTGNNNHFIGFRFERNPANSAETLNIFFSSNTFANNIEASWQSSVRYTNVPYTTNGLLVVNDLGSQNTIRHTQESASDEKCLLDLSEGASWLSSFESPFTGLRKYATDIEGVFSVDQRLDRRYTIKNNHTLLFESGLIPVNTGDCVAFDSAAAAYEQSNKLIRPRIYVYDNDRNLIVDTDFSSALPVSGSSVYWFDEDKYFAPKANLEYGFIAVTDTTKIKYIRICMYSGNATSGAVFDHLRVVCRCFKKGTQSVRDYHHIHKAKRLTHITYDSSVNMAKIGKGIHCYSKDLATLSVNVGRSEHFIIAVNGNSVTLDQIPDYSGTGSESKMLCQDAATGDILTLDIASVASKVVTLSSVPPAGIAAGKPVTVITTRTIAK